jgi:hypothetical protein
MRYPTFAPATSSIRSRKRRCARRRDSREEISAAVKGRAGMPQDGLQFAMALRPCVTTDNRILDALPGDGHTPAACRSAHS